MYRRSAALKLSIVYNYDGLGGIAEKKILTAGHPADAMPSLYPPGGVGANDWEPTDVMFYSMGILPLGAESGESFNASFDSFTNIGMESWEIEDLGRVGGKLQIGLWKSTQDPEFDPPDEEGVYTLGTSGWSTGDLPVKAWNSDTHPEEYVERWTQVRWRWFPGHLAVRAP